MTCNIEKNKTKNKTIGTIFDIKRFAIHDGPGIRTTVFFKGCPLNCQWCHNPESISPTPELTWREGFCISCGNCIKSCPSNSLYIEKASNRISLNENSCQLTGKCVQVCPTEALTITGRNITPAQILTEIEKDRIFYKNSDGGVTFSGGEPLAQVGFLAECLELCQNVGLHCTVDTSCYANIETIDKIIPLADLFLCDIKHMDSETHIQYTGVENSTILANIQRISAAGKSIIVRVPLIPGINDSQSNLEATKKFVDSLETVLEIEYLPYNSGGKDKQKIFLKANNQC